MAKKGKSKESQQNPEKSTNKPDDSKQLSKDFEKKGGSSGHTSNKSSEKHANQTAKKGDEQNEQQNHSSQRIPKKQSQAPNWLQNVPKNPSKEAVDSKAPIEKKISPSDPKNNGNFSKQRLPNEVLYDIIKMMPTQSIMNVQSVSRCIGDLSKLVLKSVYNECHRDLVYLSSEGIEARLEECEDVAIHVVGRSILEDRAFAILLRQLQELDPPHEVIGRILAVKKGCHNSILDRLIEHMSFEDVVEAYGHRFCPQFAKESLKKQEQFTVQFDLSNYDSWLLNKSLRVPDTTGLHPKKHYIPSHSHTYVDSGRKINDNYGSGSLALDVFSIGGGIADVKQDNVSSFIHTISDQLDKKVFTIWSQSRKSIWDHTTSKAVITLGGWDEQNCHKDNWFSTPIIDLQNWAFNVQSIHISGSDGSVVPVPAQSPTQAKAGHDTVFVIGPKEQIEFIAKQIGAWCYTEFGIYYTSCSNASTANIFFDFGEGSVVLKPEDYIVPQMNNICMTIFATIENKQTWFLGSRFFNSNCGAWNFGEMKMGFSPSVKL
uniref:F-box domain-containing protein n=1 Tax=Ditylenchus dipsaci TaxID=166011 RepID=A0A915D182_9BILA